MVMFVGSLFCVSCVMFENVCLDFSSLFECVGKQLFQFVIVLVVYIERFFLGKKPFTYYCAF